MAQKQDICLMNCTSETEKKMHTPDLLQFNWKAIKKLLLTNESGRETWINKVSCSQSPSSGQCRSSAVPSDGVQARGEQGGERHQGRGRGVEAWAAIL